MLDRSTLFAHKASRFTLYLTAAIATSVTALPAAKSADAVKIGFYPPLTGLETSEGLVHQKALNLAVKQINAAGGIKGKQIELITIDNKSSPQGALEAYQTLVNKEKVFAIIGTIKSAQVVAIMPEARKYEVPMVIGGTAVRLTEEGHKWFFRTRPNDSIAAAAMVKYVKENTKFTKLAIINDTSAFGTGGGNLVAKAINELGMTLVKRETFAPGEETRFAPIMKSIKDSGAEAVFVYVGTNDDQGKLMVEHQKVGKSFLYFGSPSGASKPALTIAKDAADGALAIMDFVIGQSEASKKYADEYRKEYNEEPDPQSLYTYDGMMIFAKAMSEVGLDHGKMRDYILKMKDYKGVIGTYNFDPQGNGLHEVSVVKIQKGAPQLLKVVATK